jgi:protein gp37
MSDNSAIEWTDATWPVVTGCDYESPGCAHCYAVRDARRLSGNPNEKVRAAYSGLVDLKGGQLRWTGVVRILPERLDWPQRWRKPRKVFVCNQSDLFHEDVPESFILSVLTVIEKTPRHTYQILTKRPARMRDVITRHAQWMDYAGGAGTTYAQRFRHLWLGVSVENQRMYDTRIGDLLRTPAAVHFISLEPLLGPVDLRLGGASLPDYAPHHPLPPLKWVIVGGESGPGARPFKVAWARSVLQQCKAAGVACFVKQLGARPTLSETALDPSWPPHVYCDNDDIDRLVLRDKKGGDPSEWAPDLRVRAYPS